LTKTFLIMAGGTGGHVYPALATAHELMEKGDRVVWLGSVGGFEEKVVQDAGLEFHGISVTGLRGKGLLTLVLAPFKLVMAIAQARKVIGSVKPACVLGMGGFASGPGGIAAKLMGVPLAVHEQNAVAGLTNRVLAKVANTVFEAFPNSFDNTVDTKLVGNPLRREICEIYYRPKELSLTGRSPRILVLGGSLGAARLNEVVAQALALMPASVRPEVKHQSGRGKLEATVEAYRLADVQAEVSEFIEDMAAMYRWADLVICRAGALTISELCAAGRGAILVPYPFAVDDHQTLNAKAMVNAGAAWLVPQSELTGESLAEILKPLINKPERIVRLANMAREIAKPDAAEAVADECRRLAYA
jgi:UDP-N-acetylglucosamine--N-acetylmuramyl-(pentapeptide) pyrophosphoryl-undecaprenol N-acetylglucosamine transferase